MDNCFAEDCQICHHSSHINKPVVFATFLQLSKHAIAMCFVKCRIVWGIDVLVASSAREGSVMKLKASVDYGMRAIMYLAVKGETCSSREISDEMAVPRDYLIQLALRLRNAGLIKARPGKNGGYVLAKAPDEITVGQILDAFDNDLKHVRQPMKKGRKASESALKVRELHTTIIDSLNAYLESITVQDLLDSMNGEASARELISNALAQEANRLQQ